MQINSTNQTPKFMGYKNVIHNVTKTSGKSDSFSYIAMQLDNIGTKDLDIWHSIQKGFLKRTKLEDTITFGIFNYEGKNRMLLSNYSLTIPEKLKSTEVEKLILRAYTLVASLTRRIAEGYPIFYDKDYKKTLLEVRENLLPIFENDIDFVNRYILEGISPQMEHKEPSKFINNEIQKEMNKYFED